MEASETPGDSASQGVVHAGNSSGVDIIPSKSAALVPCSAWMPRDLPADSHSYQSLALLPSVNCFAT